MPTSQTASSRQNVPPTVLIMCADEAVAGELIRELAARRYQPLVGRPGWSWKAALEWAHPAAAVVDRQHPVARSDGFLTASGDLDVGVVVFGGPAETPVARPRARAGVATVLTADPRLIGGAVDSAVKRR